MRIYTYTDKYGVQLTGTLPEIGARLIDGGERSRSRSQRGG